LADIKHSAQICLITDIADDTKQLKMKYNFECSEAYSKNKVLNKYNGRISPVVDVGDSKDRSMSINFTTYTAADITQLKALEDSDKILYFVDNRERTMYCTISPDSLKIQNKKSKNGYEVSMDLTEVDSGV
jgi:hypothetical protein